MVAYNFFELAENYFSWVEKITAGILYYMERDRGFCFICKIIAKMHPEQVIRLDILF